MRRGEITHIPRRYRRGDLAGAFLVIAADSDRAVRAEVFAEAEAERVLCNAVDDVEHCHFAVPSIVRRGELLLAISTGGRAPALAKRIRRRLTEQFGWQWEALVDVLGEVRAETLPTRTVDFATWAARWQSVLDREEELLDLLDEGRIEEVRAPGLRRLEARHHVGPLLGVGAVGGVERDPVDEVAVAAEDQAGHLAGRAPHGEGVDDVVGDDLPHLLPPPLLGQPR